MKKIFLAVIGCLLSAAVYADSPSTIADQFLATLTQHVSAVNEFTSRGGSKLEMTDGIIQVGHFNGNYIGVIDAGFLNGSGANSGNIEMTVGLHAHLFSAIEPYLNINPTYKPLFDQIEADPRVSYDGDVHRVVYGWTLGFVKSF